MRARSTVTRRRLRRTMRANMPRKPRLRLHPYKAASESGKALAEALGLKRIATNSSFRARANDVIISWGASSIRCSVHPETTIFNTPESVHNAANKVRAFRLFKEHEVPTFEHTESRERALELYRSGHTIYARTIINGNSGAGIVVCNHTNEISDEDFPNAQLYTVGIEGKRREWRVHVFDGQAIHAQQKKRRNGFTEVEGASNDVRNLSGGWVFADAEETIPEPVKEAAIKAIESLGMRFGGVDIITKQGLPYVLECNSAVGIGNQSTLLAYKTAIESWWNEYLREKGFSTI